MDVETKKQVLLRVARAICEFDDGFDEVVVYEEISARLCPILGHTADREAIVRINHKFCSLEIEGGEPLSPLHIWKAAQGAADKIKTQLQCNECGAGHPDGSIDLTEELHAEIVRIFDEEGAL